MITVKEILDRPLFKGFRLVSGSSGLCNHVLSTGFLEWETGAKIVNSFPESEFVITTLSAVKHDLQAAEEILTCLIECKVAAIAIKSVYLRTIPDTIEELSNRANVPILFFDDVYIDDLLFDLKTSILENDSRHQKSIISKLLSTPSLSAEKRKGLALQLDSGFKENLIFAAFICEEQERLPILPEADSGETKKSRETASFQELLGTGNYKYSFLPYEGGILCLYTASQTLPLSAAQIQSFLAPYFPNEKKYQIGISLQNAGLDTITQAIQEAMYAHVSCKINQVSCMEFSSTGVDRFLCFASESEWARRYFSDLLEKIQTNVDSPDVLLKTVVTYVQCGGNVILTSKNLYQHSNTIRYRLSRVQELWGTRNDIDFDAQALLFTRLYFLYHF